MDRSDEGTKKFAHTRGTPPRIAPRLEGKVRNIGIKPKKKQKRKQKNRRGQQRGQAKKKL